MRTVCCDVLAPHTRATLNRNDPKWGVELVNDPPATTGLLSSFRQTHTYEAPGLFHVLNDQGKGPMAGEGQGGLLLLLSRL